MKKILLLLLLITCLSACSNEQNIVVKNHLAKQNENFNKTIDGVDVVEEVPKVEEVLQKNTNEPIIVKIENNSIDINNEIQFSVLEQLSLVELIKLKDVLDYRSGVEILNDLKTTYLKQHDWYGGVQLDLDYNIVNKEAVIETLDSRLELVDSNWQPLFGEYITINCYRDINVDKDDADYAEVRLIDDNGDVVFSLLDHYIDIKGSLEMYLFLKFDDLTKTVLMFAEKGTEDHLERRIILDHQEGSFKIIFDEFMSYPILLDMDDDHVMELYGRTEIGSNDIELDGFTVFEKRDGRYIKDLHKTLEYEHLRLLQLEKDFELFHDMFTLKEYLIQLCKLGLVDEVEMLKVKYEADFEKYNAKDYDFYHTYMRTDDIINSSIDYWNQEVLDENLTFSNGAYITRSAITDSFGLIYDEVESFASDLSGATTLNHFVFGDNHVVTVDAEKMTVYYFSTENGDIEVLGQPLTYDYGYTVSEVSRVTLQNSPNAYLKITLKNEGEVKGIDIVEVRKEGLTSYKRSLSTTQTGFDDLLDTDRDGREDTLISFRSSKDVMDFPMIFTYTHTQDGFVLSDTRIDLANENDELECLINFVKLSALETVFESEKITALVDDLKKSYLTYPEGWEAFVKDYYAHSADYSFTDTFGLKVFSVERDVEIELTVVEEYGRYFVMRIVDYKSDVIHEHVEEN